MEVSKILDEARNSVGEYCMRECNAYCCKKEMISLSDAEAELFKGSEKLLKKDDYFVLIASPCPRLKNNRCTIHNKRPLSCREFPVFQKDNKIYLANICPAVIAGKLYPFTKKLVDFGYKFKSDYILIKD